LVKQRHFGDAAQVFLQADAGGIHAVGDAGPCIRTVRVGFEKAVTQAGGVAQQLPRADSCWATVGQAWLEFRQPVIDACVQVELAPCHQHHGRGGDDGLADRRQPEHGVHTHRARAGAVGEAAGLAVDQLAVTGDHDDCADQALFVQCLLHDGLDGGQNRVRRGS